MIIDSNKKLFLCNSGFVLICFSFTDMFQATINQTFYTLFQCLWSFSINKHSTQVLVHRIWIPSVSIFKQMRMFFANKDFLPLSPNVSTTAVSSDRVTSNVTFPRLLSDLHSPSSSRISDVSESTLTCSRFKLADKTPSLPEVSQLELGEHWSDSITQSEQISRSFESISFNTVLKNVMYFIASLRISCLESFLSGGYVGRSFLSSPNAILT